MGARHAEQKDERAAARLGRPSRPATNTHMCQTQQPEAHGCGYQQQSLAPSLSFVFLSKREGFWLLSVLGLAQPATAATHAKQRTHERFLADSFRAKPLPPSSHH